MSHIEASGYVVTDLALNFMDLLEFDFKDYPDRVKNKKHLAMQDQK